MGINGDTISSAKEKLQGGSDMVLGPAVDGRYYLVGFRKDAMKYLGRYKSSAIEKLPGWTLCWDLWQMEGITWWASGKTP